MTFTSPNLQRNPSYPTILPLPLLQNSHSYQLHSSSGHLITIHAPNYRDPSILLNSQSVLHHNFPRRLSKDQFESFCVDLRATVSILSSGANTPEYKIYFSQRGRGGGGVNCVSQASVAQVYPDFKLRTEGNRWAKKTRIGPLQVIQDTNTGAVSLTTPNGHLSPEKKAKFEEILTIIKVERTIMELYGLDYWKCRKQRTVIKQMFLSDMKVIKMMKNLMFARIKDPEIVHISDSFQYKLNTVLEIVELEELPKIIERINFTSSRTGKPISQIRDLQVKDWIIHFSKPFAKSLVAQGLLKTFELEVDKEQVADALVERVHEENLNFIETLRGTRTPSCYDYKPMIEEFLKMCKEKHFKRKKTSKLSTPRIDDFIEKFPKGIADITIDTPYFTDLVTSIELEILLDTNFLSHDLRSLVKLFNKLRKYHRLTKRMEKRKKQVREMIKSVLDFYKRRVTVSEEGFNEVSDLAKVDEKGLVREYFHFVLDSLNFDEKFRPYKIDAIHQVVISGIQSFRTFETITPHASKENLEDLKKKDDHTDYIGFEDLMDIIDMINRKLENYSGTTLDEAPTEVLYSLVRLVFTMISLSFHHYSKDHSKDLQEYCNNILQRFRSHNFDEINRDFACKMYIYHIKESIKRISDPEAYAWIYFDEVYLDLQKNGCYMSSQLESREMEKIYLLLRETSQQISIMAERNRDHFYHEINYFNHLLSHSLEDFIKFYFLTSHSDDRVQILKVSEKHVQFFIIDQLERVTRNPTRSVEDRTKAIKILWHIYYDCYIDDHTKLMGKFKLNENMKIFIKKRLLYLSQMPPEIPETQENPIATLARQTLAKLTAHEFQNPELKKFEEGLKNLQFIFTGQVRVPYKKGYEEALRGIQKTEYIFSQAQRDCIIQHKKYNEDPHLKLDGLIKRSKHSTVQNQPILLNTGALNFVQNSTKKVLLVHGDAGTGKTYFLRELEHYCWKSYNEGSSLYIPIFIPLSDVMDPVQSVENYFFSYGANSETVQEIMSSEMKFLFLFDGFDELRMPINLWLSSSLDKWGLVEHTKMVVTCRSEFLNDFGNEYPRFFVPDEDFDPCHPLETLEELRICPIQEERIKGYIERYAAIKREKSVELDNSNKIEPLIPKSAYQNYVQKYFSSNKLDQVTIGLIKILLELTPKLHFQNKFEILTSKSQLFKLFTKIKFSDEAAKLVSQTMEASGSKSEYINSFYNYSLDLAFTLYSSDRTSINADVENYQKFEYLAESARSSRNKKSPLKSSAINSKKFFSNDPKIKMGRGGAPIVIHNGNLRFIHQTVLEYFVARVHYEVLKCFDESDNLSGSVLDKRVLPLDDKESKDSSILKFLMEMVRRNTETHHQKIPRSQNVLAERTAKQNLERLLSPFLKKPVEKDIHTLTLEQNAESPALPLDSPLIEHIYMQNILIISMGFPEIFEKVDNNVLVYILKSPVFEPKLKAFMSFELYLRKKTMVSDINSAILSERSNTQGNVGRTPGSRSREYEFLIAFEKEKENRPDNKLKVQDIEKCEDIEECKQGENHKIDKDISQVLEDLAIQAAKARDEYACKWISFMLQGHYQGEYLEDGPRLLAQGKGKLISEQWIYDGQWIENQKCGYGVLQWVDGSYYKGEWQNDLQHGFGTLRTKEEYYVGEWVDGKKQGSGKIVDTSGIEHQGFWIEGKLIGKLKIDFAALGTNQPIFDLRSVDKFENMSPSSPKKLEDGSILFDSSKQQYLTFDLKDKLKIPCTNFRIEAQFKTSQKSFGLFSLESHYSDRDLWANDGNLYLCLIPKGFMEIPCDENLNDNDWHTWAIEMSYSQGTRVFFDGEQVAHDPINEIGSIPQKINIGFCPRANSPYFDGIIRQLSIQRLPEEKYEKFRCFEYQPTEEGPIKEGVMIYTSGKQELGRFVEGVYINPKDNFKFVNDRFLEERGFLILSLFQDAVQIEKSLNKNQVHPFSINLGSLEIHSFSLKFTRSDHYITRAKPDEMIDFKLDFAFKRNQYLGKKPSFIVLGGLTSRRCPDFVVTSSLHAQREKIEGAKFSIKTPKLFGIYQIRLQIFSSLSDDEIEQYVMSYKKKSKGSKEDLKFPIWNQIPDPQKCIGYILVTDGKQSKKLNVTFSQIK